MKFGICNEIFKDWNDIERTIEYVKSIGYDGLEIAPFTLSQYVTDIDSETRRKIVKKAAEVDLEMKAKALASVDISGLPAASRQRKPTASVMDFMRNL